MLHDRGLDRLAHDLARYTPATQPDRAASEAASVNADATERAGKIYLHAFGVLEASAFPLATRGTWRVDLKTFSRDTGAIHWLYVSSMHDHGVGTTRRRDRAMEFACQSEAIAACRKFLIETP